MQKRIIVIGLFLLSGCVQLELNSTEKVLKSYDLENYDFKLQVYHISSPATSPNFIQVRRLYRDSSYEIAYNIANRDSFINLKVQTDEVSLVVKGKERRDFIKNDTVRFSINNKWNDQRFVLKKKSGN